MNEEIDYKRLITEARNTFSHEWQYGKLSGVEKLTILLSAVAFIVVLGVVGLFALHHLLAALITVLADALQCQWGAHLIVVGLLLLLVLVVVAFKKQLIVNPIARFLSKLFLKPEDNE